jgi:hypothetical protein
LLAWLCGFLGDRRRPSFLEVVQCQIERWNALRHAELFPDEPQPVFAQWYTGVLTLPYGELLKYVHAGFESIYEFSMHLTIENGRVVDKVIQKNEAPPSDELDDLDEDLC